MSDIKIQPSATGSGTVTITAPTTNTARVITLPDSAGTLLDENSSVPSANLTGTVVDARISALTASKLTGDLPAISGVNVTNVHAVNSGRKNMVINGAMQVAQRGTSATGINTDSSATEGYRTIDRFLFGGNDAGVWTMTQDSDSPVGFGSSMKLDCTTAKSSLDAGSYLYVLNRIEAQDLQHLGYGTSSPQAITLSFWVKSPKTGTHYTELYHMDSSGSTKRKNSYAYTVSSANTWEKKSMTFAGATGLNAIVNDTGTGLMLTWYLATGSNMTSGTNTNDNWHNTEANRTPGQVNCADSTSNNFYLTGVQLEVGSVATDFEHRSYGEELALCERYYETSMTHGDLSQYQGQQPVAGMASATYGATASSAGGRQFRTWKRANPTVTIYHQDGTAGAVYLIHNAAKITGVTASHINQNGFLFVTKSSGFNSGYYYYYGITVDAEL